MNPGKVRQSRALRRDKPVRGRVTERDRAFLAALARTRYLTTTLIALLLFNGSRRIANRRARRLLDLGLVRCWVPTLNHDNIYALTAAGRRLLEDSGDDLPDTIQCARQLDAQWHHELAINSFRVRLAVDLERGSSGLSWWRSNRELRTAGRSSTIPDALFAIEWSPGDEQVYALEVEYRTRAPQAFLKKVARYVSVPYRPTGLYGEPHVAVLMVGQDPIWLDRYLVATARLALPVTIGFATVADVERHRPTGEIWWTPFHTEKVWLRNLRTCGYRNYTHESENLHGSTPITGQAAHITDVRVPPQGNQP